METYFFRVMAKGRFVDLSEATRADLLDRADQHQPLRAGFSADGSLSYDARLDFFTFRFEIRERAEDAAAAKDAAFARAMDLARERLEHLGLGHRDLRCVGHDVADAWR